MRLQSSYKITSTIDAIVNQEPGHKLSDAELQARKHLLNLAENVISLIWCLAEANHKTLAAINSAGIEGLLFRAIAGRDLLGQGVALAAAQALYALSQDNALFSRAVASQPIALAELVNVVKADHTHVVPEGKGKGKSSSSSTEGDGKALLTRVLASGALRNLVYPGSRVDASIDIVGLTNSTILPLVNSLLDLDLQAIVQRVLDLSAQNVSRDMVHDQAITNSSPAKLLLLAKTLRSTTSLLPR